MSIFDKFKKTKKQPEKKAKIPAKKAEIKEKPKTETPKAEKTAKSIKRVEKKQFSQAWQFLESPHVTEKAGMLVDKNNSYIFKVSSAANKNGVKNAVQDLYGVAVTSVNIINIPRKAKRVGRNEGFKPGFKKAIVKLAEGEKIEIMPR